MAPPNDVFALCDLIRQTSFALHRYLRHGHLEKVYENGLAHRLRKAGLQVQQQYPLHVCDEDGDILGQYFADLWIEFPLLVELKPVTPSPTPTSPSYSATYAPAASSTACSSTSAPLSST